MAKFISFEGTEGVGKSTLIKGLAETLAQRQIDFIQTREPGGSPFAETLRSVLLDSNNHMSDDSELLLMFAARADHLETVIKPALAQGKWVLCDRFIDSTYAYQGYGRQYGAPTILEKIDLLTKNFVDKLPDITIWLDLDIVEGMQRAKNRSKLDRFEQEKISFFERVYQGYTMQAQHAPERVKRIDAKGDIATVLSRVMTVLDQ